MRVFVLCSGRTGSTSFIRACEHIKNFTAGHESQAKETTKARFEYPDNHIEADNRLSWFLGPLDRYYGDDAHYVLLKREKSKVVKSFDNRWDNQGSIMKAFAEGILKQVIRRKEKHKKSQIARLYFDTVYSNIDLFLKDKSNVLEIHLESIEEDFVKFWNWIGAQGNLKKALTEFGISHNATKKRRFWHFGK